MFVALQIATALAVLSEPFLPFTSTKLKNILNVSLSAVEGSLGWADVSTKETLLPATHQINKGELLFRKVEDSEIQTQLDKLAATKKANENANKELMPQKDTINFDDFSKLDMRVGTIVEAEKMAKKVRLKLLVLLRFEGLRT
jgi:methionyl-tRNA synthetase